MSTVSAFNLTTLTDSSPNSESSSCVFGALCVCVLFIWIVIQCSRNMNHSKHFRRTHKFSAIAWKIWSVPTLSKYVCRMIYWMCLCVCVFNYNSFNLIRLHLNHKRNSWRIRCVHFTPHLFKCLSNIFVLCYFSLQHAWSVHFLWSISIEFLLNEKYTNVLWIRHKITKLKKKKQIPYNERVAQGANIISVLSAVISICMISVLCFK